MRKAESFQKLTKKLPREREEGWDEKAIEYARLPETNRIFRLKKELLYEVIEKDIFPGIDNRDIHVLDFNCGCGNDFSFFLEKGWHVTGCDGSAGMLNVAFEKFRDRIDNGHLELFHGMAEDMDQDSFEGRKFDLVFSTTGGFSYVDDAEFVREHRILLDMLKPGGKLLTAHLTPFCLAESLYEILHFRFSKARMRWKKTLTIVVKDEEFTMYLRSSGRIGKLLKETGRLEKKYAILTLTPPYQTGYNPGHAIVKLHKAIDRKLLRFGPATKFSDQVAFRLSKRD